jgi:hypothetical protein
MEQPRGPVFDARVRANYHLARRMAKDQHVKIDEVDGRLARGGDELGKNGVPSDRRVREWMAKMPDYPERMIQSGIITESHILPWLRPYLTSGDSTARLEQRNPIQSAPGHTQVRDSGPARKNSQGRSGGRGLLILAALLLGVGLLQRRKPPLQPAPLPPGTRWLPPPVTSRVRRVHYPL